MWNKAHKADSWGSEAVTIDDKLAGVMDTKNLADVFTKNVDAGTVSKLNDVLCGYKIIKFTPDDDGRKFNSSMSR